MYRREPEGFTEQMRLEAHELSGAQFGPELLVALGDMYQLRAEIYLANELSGRFSLSKRAASARHTAVHLRHGMQFCRSAAGSLIGAKKLYSTATRQSAVKEGDEEAAKAAQEVQAKEVEAALDQALPGFLQTAWSYVVRDVDSTTKQVGRKLLQDKAVPWQVRIRRAQALQCLGQIFREVAAEKDPTTVAASEEVKAKLHEAFAGAVREKK